MEMKQYTVAGKAFTLVLKQNTDGTWECDGFDSATSATNEVIKASDRSSKRDAQFAAHAALYELHSLRCDQKFEADCDKDWVPVHH